MKVERDIRQKLGQAPKDLTAAYDQIYALIEGEEDYGREAAKCTLMWIVCTAEPLTMEMLLEFTRIQPSTWMPTYISLANGQKVLVSFAI